jgi:streptomycin 6-kinase
LRRPRDRAGADLVLKVAWGHPEALHEADGLRAWAEHGAVRLHAAEESPDTVGLLLERCRPGTPLAELSERRQDVVVAELLRQLWSAPVSAPGSARCRRCAICGPTSSRRASRPHRA